MSTESEWLSRGGILRPGWVRAVNRTSKPERVVTGTELNGGKP